MNSPAGLQREYVFYLTDSLQFRVFERRWRTRICSDDARRSNQESSCGRNRQAVKWARNQAVHHGKPDDTFACIKQYVSKLNPLCNAFFQQPRPRIRSEDPVWYANKPLGENSLGNMMKSITTGCNLSKIYTNHSVRATAISLWSDADIPDRQVTFVSGHSNEDSLAP